VRDALVPLLDRLDAPTESYILAAVSGLALPELYRVLGRLVEYGLVRPAQVGGFVLTEAGHAVRHDLAFVAELAARLRRCGTMAWNFSVLMMPDGGTYPVAIPPMEGDVQGWSVNMTCPRGCVHTVAIELTFLEAMETAAARLQAHPAPGVLLTAAIWGPGDPFAKAREELDGGFRGSVH